MKAKLIIGFIAIAVAALAGWNINKNQNEVILSELALANVEALANGESGEKTAPACKGEAYIYGPMKRVKDSHSKCVMQNITKVEEDGICWY